MTTNTQIPTLDGSDKFPAYVATPAGSPRGAIIVIQEIFGVNPGIRKKADDWAARGYLAVAPKCNACGLSFDFADAGDGAAWFVMLFTCFVGVGAILGIEVAYSPPYWVHALIAIPLIILMPLILLRPAKGILLCQQWKTKAEEARLRH